jgi:hypothetical protein
MAFHMRSARYSEHAQLLWKTRSVPGKIALGVSALLVGIVGGGIGLVVAASVIMVLAYALPHSNPRIDALLLVLASVFCCAQGALLALYVLERFVLAPRAFSKGARDVQCIHCDYDLRGLSIAGGAPICPECGKQSGERVRVRLGKQFVFLASVVESAEDPRVE